jgi:ligand-binding SRPBCC domain-containing protein
MKAFKRIQNLPISLSVAWEFFSDPKNLKMITPPSMGFDITSELTEGKMYEGMIITYKVSPFLGIPVDWVTEITHVEEHAFFVDNQKSGPFKFWHHQHIFKKVENGIEMTDIVNYAVPVPLTGNLLESLLIEKKVNEIFDFRYQVLEKMFRD